jgi:N-acetylmuramoyl-L-alanine amidase
LLGAIVLLLAGLGVGIALSSTGGRQTERAARPLPTRATGASVSTLFRATATVPGSRPNESRTVSPAVPGTQASSARHAPRPRIVQKLIPFGATRRAEMAKYAQRHYGINTWRLDHPHVIVEHYTATTTFSSVYNTFSADVRDVELHELPGVCSHFVIDTDGTIYQLVQLTTMCRHTVGLNYTAIGIEHVGMSDQEILSNPQQLRASLALTLWLMQKEGIELRNVIGHNETLTSPYHKELYAPWRCQTHGDWNRADMDVYRSKLSALAKRYSVKLGPPAKRVTPQC